MSEDIHKWTDGRYTLMFDEHTFFVWDHEEEKRMTALRVTKKLNEQQDQIRNMKAERRKLKEENERLHHLKVLANAFIVEKGLEGEFIKWGKENKISSSKKKAMVIK